MNARMIVYLTGQIVRVIGVLLIFPMIVAGVCGEKASLIAFFATAAGMIALGTAVTFKKPENKAVYAREGMAVVSIS